MWANDDEAFQALEPTRSQGSLSCLYTVSWTEWQTQAVPLCCWIWSLSRGIGTIISVEWQQCSWSGCNTSLVPRPFYFAWESKKRPSINCKAHACNLHINCYLLMHTCMYMYNDILTMKNLYDDNIQTINFRYNWQNHVTYVALYLRKYFLTVLMVTRIVWQLFSSSGIQHQWNHRISTLLEMSVDHNDGHSPWKCDIYKTLVIYPEKHLQTSPCIF